MFLDVIESVNLLVSILFYFFYPQFLSYIFKIAIQASTTGNVLRSEIVGSIKMRVYLSGMPELRLGLNDKVLFESTGRGKSKSVELEDVKFHQCVRLSRYKLAHFCLKMNQFVKFCFVFRFENDRTISFIPPDGEFELMSYRLNTHVSLPSLLKVIKKNFGSNKSLLMFGFETGEAPHLDRVCN